MQPLSVTVDTGSSWIILASMDNKETSGPKFNYTASTTFKRLADDTPLILIFGKGWIRGDLAVDDIYFDDDGTTGVKQMEFVLAEQSNNLDPDSGLIGFSRNIAPNATDNSTKQPKLAGTTYLTKLSS